MNLSKMTATKRLLSACLKGNAWTLECGNQFKENIFFDKNTHTLQKSLKSTFNQVVRTSFEFVENPLVKKSSKGVVSLLPPVPLLVLEEDARLLAHQQSYAYKTERKWRFHVQCVDWCCAWWLKAKQCSCSEDHRLRRQLPRASGSPHHVSWNRSPHKSPPPPPPPVCLWERVRVPDDVTVGTPHRVCVAGSWAPGCPSCAVSYAGPIRGAGPPQTRRRPQPPVSPWLPLDFRQTVSLPGLCGTHRNKNTENIHRLEDTRSRDALCSLLCVLHCVHCFALCFCKKIVLGMLLLLFETEWKQGNTFWW